MIVAFGTINVDMVTVVSRFPVPGETVKGRDYQLFPGGKGANQALAAARAGASVVLVGAVGRDGLADVALANLKAAGVDVSRVGVSASPTGVYMIAIGPGGENLMIGANAANDSARATWLEGLFRPGVTFVTQNSLGTAEVEVAIRMAREAGARVVYNAAPAEPVAEATFAAADVIVVNEHEARRYGEILDLPADPAGFARAAAARFGRDVVVTVGSQGIVGCVAGRFVSAPPPPVAAVDTTGAGDAFCGALAAALDRGATMETALREGLAAGALACRETGAQTSFRDLAEIRALAAGVSLAWA
ncbi:PfkB family carbohydrate kinase [Prosthecomicrobium sp. N25]|uniref:PfkB family carbohydrate kinase n=1 Tax=Prosthecomicrobium sp. N25 TaxID=3129254 RepID=UPI003076A79D